MVTIEAMCMGCVPMAYDIPSGSTEIIEPGRSGVLLELGDIRGWAERISELHGNRARLAELSAGAIRRAREDFDAATMSRNMAAFLGDVWEHAAQYPAERETGLPPEMPAAYAQPARGYQRLPLGLREWFRNAVCASPRLSYWLLNR